MSIATPEKGLQCQPRTAELPGQDLTCAPLFQVGKPRLREVPQLERRADRVDRPVPSALPPLRASLSPVSPPLWKFQIFRGRVWSQALPHILEERYKGDEPSLFLQLLTKGTREGGGDRVIPEESWKALRGR